MSDLSAAIQPKADQLTADDLIAGPLTLKITDVSVVKTPEQPVAISYDGDGGKPWKPCKSMTRVLVQMWGPDSSKFPGRSVTVYRDASVKWGGLEVGGIRISHMSHIQGSQTMALTITRGSKKPFTVRPLVIETRKEPAPKKVSISEWLDNLEAELKAADDAAAVDAILGREDVKNAEDKLRNGAHERLMQIIKAATPAPADADPDDEATDEAA